MKNLNIQNFKVPTDVFVNPGNNKDYIKIPIKNLDSNDLMSLCSNFMIEVFKESGYNVIVKINSNELKLIMDNKND